MENYEKVKDEIRQLAKQYRIELNRQIGDRMKEMIHDDK